MKKIKYLLLIIPFLFLTSVKAEKNYVFYVPSSSDDAFLRFSGKFGNFTNSDVYTPSFIDSQIKDMVSEWEEKYKKDYPYYVISVTNYELEDERNIYNEGIDMSISLHMLDAIPASYGINDYLYSGTHKDNNGNNIPYIVMNFSDGIYVDGLHDDWQYIFYDLNSSQYPRQYYYLATEYYDSNFDLSFGKDYTITVKHDEEVLFTLDSPTDIVPTYKSKFVDKVDLNYIEIDLNKYPYVALSLKDYNQTEEFNSLMFVKGQYCLTSVYNYGLTERKDIISGTQMQRCSLAYDDYTPLRTYVLKSDLENHAIYYLKAYDTTIENKIKVDTTIFNIHLITEEEADNPILNINGKSYTTLPYDELTDTATKSEEENYVSGGSCNVGDFNCTATMVGSSFSWSDIFTSPIDFLKKIWTSITQVFVLITYFIALLPTTLQMFLYFSFMLAIILGIIKILL